MSGRPIWPKGREEEKNLFVGFRAVFRRGAGERCVLRVTGSSVYRIFVNGEFFGYGPARGPHGYYRVDEWELGAAGLAEECLVAIEVAGYNVNSYYLLDQASFVQAEVVSGGKVLASTGGEGASFEASILKHRVQKVQRYSFQRPFIEYYRMPKESDQWRREISASFEKIECEVTADKKVLGRRVGYPDFLVREPIRHICRGQIERDAKIDNPVKDRAITDIGPKLKGFAEEELEVIPSVELQQVRPIGVIEMGAASSTTGPFHLDENSFRIVDFGTDLTGFIGARVKCHKNTKLFVTFDEILSDGDVDFMRGSSGNVVCNVVSYEFEPGVYDVESFEPYTFRYLKFIVFEGECEVEKVYLREYSNSETSRAHFSCSDDRLNKIFEAAKETFCQNAVDIFMDCPSRERAGWLCDSFFTARVAYDLCGNTKIEKNFFENYLLPERFENLPDGMLPMCYPADHYDGVFIPNWGLWFVVQLAEYLQRSGDCEMVAALESKVMGLFEYFEQFKNEYGLLERLEGWVLVEWSAANRFVQNVNYPTNMLYAAALSAAGKLYDKTELIEQAEKIKRIIRDQSFDGQFFVDNAVRGEGEAIIMENLYMPEEYSQSVVKTKGELEVTDNHSETCQYYAFFFGVGDPETHKELLEKLCGQFGPARSESKAYCEVHASNAFIGNFLRMELLSRFGLYRQLKDEIVGYFLYMVEQTGTLWEHMDPSCSCSHGFASHVAHCLYRDVLGICRIDSQAKTVELRFSDVGLQSCQGALPIGDDIVSLRWWIDGDIIRYQADVPAGYEIKVENISGRQLVEA